MANKIQVKRSAVPAKVPTTTDLDLGEIGINTYDGKMYIKQDNGTPAIVQIGAGGGGSGDVVGPSSATDNAITRFDSTTGKLIQNSTVTLSDTGNLSGVTSIITPDYITYDTTATGVSITPGITTWNDGEGVLDVGLKGGNVTLNVGTQEYARVYNDSGVTLTKGQAVYISGAQGNRIAVKLARANVEATSFGTIGLVAETMTNGSEGFIIVSGALYKLNTTGLTGGATVYLSPTTAGAITTTKPQAPDQLVVIGWVERVDNIVGSIYIKIDNGYELDELHDVQITSPTSGNLLIYDATTSPTGVWKNANLTAGTGISVSNGAGSVTVTNSAPDQTVALTGAGTTTITGTYPNFTITSNDQYTGTVTSVTGTAPIASSGGATPAISISQATTSTDGYLSSTDWNTFNGKQDALVSGTNIKTVNGTTLLGSGDLGTIGSAYGGTGFSTYATGDLVYASATNTLSKLTAGTNGYVLTLASGVPTWAAASGGGSFFSPYVFTATASQTTFAVGVTLGAIQVFVNGTLQIPSTDYSISGTDVVLATGVASGTKVEVIVYDAFSVANTYSQSVIDTNFAAKTSLGDLAYLNTVGTTEINNSSVTVGKISATGTPSASTYLRGDGSWASATPSLLAGQIIETISSPCDGSTVVVQSGSYTVQNVTTQQLYVGATYTDITGSSLSYTPPAGTTRVEYEFQFASYWVGAHAINDYKFFIDGAEVVFARHNRSSQYLEDRSIFRWTIAIGGTPNANTGRIATWTTPKIMKMQFRNYGASNYANLHGTTYWDALSSVQFSMPSIKITAIA
jgi:hypothetical protein